MSTTAIRELVPPPSGELCPPPRRAAWHETATAAAQPPATPVVAPPRPLDPAALRVAVAIPAFDAAATVGGVVRRTRALGYFVAVVDDGSSDDTAGEARRAGADLVLSQPENRGKGRALRLAFDELLCRGYDVVVTLDADGQHLPEQIPTLLAAAGEGDLVLGTRDHLFTRGMVWHRQLSNRFAAGTIGWLGRIRLRDAQTGFRLYHRRLIETVGFPEPRFQAESAVLVRAGRHGFRVVSTPVEIAQVDGRGTSHFRPVLDFLRIVGAVVRARCERRR